MSEWNKSLKDTYSLYSNNEFLKYTNWLRVFLEPSGNVNSESNFNENSVENVKLNTGLQIYYNWFFFKLLYE